MDRNEELSQDNTQKSSESKSQIECLKEGETVTGDGAAQENDPVAEENAKRRTELAAKLKYKLLNWDKIKAEEAEARAKVRDDEGEVIYNLHRRKIVRISEDLVVKKAPDIPGHEASNLRYIAANTTIPVPEVHDVRWENSKVVGLVMDYMPGKCLDDIWNTLSADQKQSIAEQLRGYICQLRGLKGDYIGAVDRGPVFTGTYTTIQGGPFDTEREFNDWLLEDLNTGIATGCTHYAKLTAILDWEFAGWYPECWEHFTAYSSFQKGKDWSKYLMDILRPEYDREFISMFYVSKLCGS